VSGRGRASGEEGYLGAPSAPNDSSRPHSVSYIASKSCLALRVIRIDRLPFRSGTANVENASGVRVKCLASLESMLALGSRFAAPVGVVGIGVPVPQENLHTALGEAAPERVDARAGEVLDADVVSSVLVIAVSYHPWLAASRTQLVREHDSVVVERARSDDGVSSRFVAFRRVSFGGRTGSTSVLQASVVVGGGTIAGRDTRSPLAEGIHRSLTLCYGGWVRLRPHSVTLRQLQYVVAIADRQSFRKAAEDCGVSQPSLSAQVAQAERALGVQLFERDRRQVMLTSAGASIVERARKLLLAADELMDTASLFGDPFSGRLRLGVIPTVGPYLLPELAPVMRKEFPKLVQVWVEDKTSVLLEKLHRGELDGAVLALEASLGDVEHAEIGVDPFLLAAPPQHPLVAAKRPIKADELRGQQVLLLDDGHCFRDQALQYCTDSGAEELGLRATSLATLTQMVAGGAGVTLLPRVALAVENRNDTLRIRSFAPRAPYRTIVLVWRKGSALEVTLRGVAETMRRTYRSLWPASTGN